jgi:hypothetical protein
MLTKKIIVLLFCLLALNASTLFAQDSLLLRDYRFVQQSSPWLTQRNAASLTLFNSENIAEAEVSFAHSNGELTNFSGSPSLNDFQGTIESYYRLSPRAVVYGAISYDNQSGKDMTGSIFMQERLPFDIVEDSLTNIGRKHRDTYHLVGAFGYTVANGLAIGMKADYTAANYAKYKDLRHKNKLMNLDFTAGVLSSFNIQHSTLHIGLDYTYHRRTESVEFGTYGKADKVYKSLIDYGALMGIVEQFGNDGYTDKTNEMPLFEDAHDVGLQLEFQPGHRSQRANDGLSLFAAVSYSHATGYYGRPSQYTITYTDHDRDIFTLQGRASYAFSASRFSLDVRYQSEKLENRINTYRGLTNEYGATYYEYYDATKSGEKGWRNFDVDYTLHLGIRHELPTWTITAGYHWQQRDITAYLYPYYRQQQLNTSEIAASVTRNLDLMGGILGVTLNGGYQTGSGDPYHDGSFVTPSAKQPQPATMEAFLYRDYEYLTAKQYHLGLQLKYSFLFPGTRLNTFVRAAFNYRHASTPDGSPSGLNNPSRTTFLIAAGHTF